jgi:hypothetical protein
MIVVSMIVGHLSVPTLTLPFAPFLDLFTVLPWGVIVYVLTTAGAIRRMDIPEMVGFLLFTTESLYSLALVPAGRLHPSRAGQCHQRPGHLPQRHPLPHRPGASVQYVTKDPAVSSSQC